MRKIAILAVVFMIVIFAQGFHLLILTNANQQLRQENSSLKAHVFYMEHFVKSQQRSLKEREDDLGRVTELLSAKDDFDKTFEKTFEKIIKERADK